MQALQLMVPVAGIVGVVAEAVVVQLGMIHLWVIGPGVMADQLVLVEMQGPTEITLVHV